jgi:hypothetical protein
VAPLGFYFTCLEKGGVPCLCHHTIQTIGRGPRQTYLPAGIRVCVLALSSYAHSQLISLTR